jgi:glycosyltransferase involved in cell wall biosynthesis
MKIAIGTKIKSGPWGGGNQFALSLKSYLESKGHQVFSDLDPRVKLDLILLTEPRQYLQTASFGPAEILAYLSVHWDTLVAHRINECDERKGTKHVNYILARSSLLADHTVFISSWLKGLFASGGLNKEASSVILNGADPEIFSSGIHSGRFHAKIPGKARLVTHHWGAHPNKGWDIYDRIDQLISSGGEFEGLEFSFIGNSPKGKNYKNISFHSPINGKALAAALADHDFYVTASLNEPAGMHHIEAALCGLPLLYRDSGALPEYCKGYGIQFSGSDFDAKLREMMRMFPDYRARMAGYPNTSLKMCMEYENLFLAMDRSRSSLIQSRKLRPGRILGAKLRAKAEEALFKSLSRAGID